MFFRAIVILLWLCAPAFAQVSLTGGSESETEVTLPDPLTPETANALLSRLSDSQVRELLLEQLNTQAVAEDEESNGLADFIYHATSGLSLIHI